MRPQGGELSVVFPHSPGMAPALRIEE